ncbi:MAG: DUF4175 family protein [Bacteroidetes bacterium]|nr:DUF4175 family protein [Bacteroidota bacterium]
MATGEIREKLDAFIRKYYLNQLVRGGLLAAALLLGLFLLINLGEYYGHFSTPVRATLFWGFALSLGGILYFWVLRPLQGLFRLGPVLGYSEAAVIIGRHFSHVEDKLLNLLQLEEMHQSHPESSLLLAGIEQKMKELRPVPFTGAIRLQENRKYLKFLAVPVAMLAVILLFQSSIITDGAQRIIQYNRHFKIKAPFEFQLRNKSLSANRGADFVIEMAVRGKSLPDEVFVVSNGQPIKMLKDEKGIYRYELKNLTVNQEFHFEAAGFASDAYAIVVKPVPAISSAEVRIQYPAYTRRGEEVVQNASDFSVPEGSTLTWKFATRDAESLQIEQGGKTETLTRNNKQGMFTFSRRFLQNSVCRVQLRNGSVAGKDTLRYAVQVIPDRAPSLFVEKKDDSTNIRQFYFLGQAGDDYGVSRVSVAWRFVKSEIPGKTAQGFRQLPLSITPGADVTFYYILNMDALSVAPGDEVEYFFEAWDNDGVHGPKVTRTQPQVLRRETLEEVRQKADATGSKVQNMMQEAYKESQKLVNKSKELQDRFNRQRNLNWDEKDKLRDLLEMQQKQNEKLEQIKKEQEKLLQQQQEFQAPKPEALDKQRQMEEMLKQMENPELKKLLEQLQELLQKQAPKEDINNKLQQMQELNRENAKEMDKLLEQFKQLQLEQKLEDNINRLEKLAEKQEKLAEKTLQEKSNKTGELKSEQQELKEELHRIQEELKEAEQMNKGLEEPMKLDMGEEEQKQAEEQMKQSGDNLDKGKGGKAGENQKNAAEQMKKAAEKMKQSLAKEKEQRLAEDYQKIRILLEGLVETSFNQEEIFTELSKLREYNPKYVELNRRQMTVKEACAFLEDSLRALAKRQPMVSSFITKEINRINTNMSYALDQLKIRNLAEASMREQYVMTGLNNLAVMLMESMQNMQAQMAQQQQSKGSKSCNNPNKQGNGKKGQPRKGDKLSKSQEQLGQMLQELQKKAQEQRNGKAGKPGEGNGNPKEGDKPGDKELNKSYAQMALMQEALRRKLAEMRQKLAEKGESEAARQLDQTAEMMEQQERELVNKRITPEMINRQKEIETRLLEHEKADRTQETEDKRESKSPGQIPPTLPPALQTYMKEKQREREMLRTTPAELTPWYREKVKEYLKSVGR